METLAEQYRDLSRRNTALKRINKRLSSWLIAFIILFLLAIGYIVYIEHFTPFFGRFPTLEQNHQALLTQKEILQSEIDSLSRVNDMLIEASPYYTGVFFEVQIGAFENFDLEKYKEGLSQLNIDYRGNVVQYTLGKFRDLSTALSFQKDMQKMGVKDAFIVAKIDGKRVPVKEAVAEAERLKNPT